MTNTRLSILSVFALSAAALAGPQEAAHPSAPAGRYVEVRTASVFAGACHYNGERVTEGRSAIAAWSIARGTFDGTDVSNTRIVAAVRGEANLADDGPRQTVLTVDAPTPAARSAAVAWLRTQTAAALGSVTAVKPGRIEFVATADETRVTAPGFAEMVVRPMPDAACCTQPQLVWYTPLAAIEGRKVGYTAAARSLASADSLWERGDENSAFYGRFGPATLAVVASR